MVGNTVVNNKVINTEKLMYRIHINPQLAVDLEFFQFLHIFPNIKLVYLRFDIRECKSPSQKSYTTSTRPETNHKSVSNNSRT